MPSYSSLTAQQESDLQVLENGVSIISGTDAGMQLINRVYGHIDKTAPQREEVYYEPSGKPISLTEDEPKVDEPRAERAPVRLDKRLRELSDMG